MPPSEELHQRLGGRQTDQRRRHELGARPTLRWACLDVPAAGRIHRGDARRRRFQGGDDAAERFPDLALETEAEDGVDHVIGALQRGVEVFREGHVQVPQLRHEPLVELVLGGFRVADGRFVAVVEEVAGGDEAVAAVVAGSADDEDFVASG